MSRELWLGVSRGLYRAFLLVCPRGFRDEVGSDIEKCFDRLTEETFDEKGPAGLISLTSRGLIDLLRTAARERCSGGKRFRKRRTMDRLLQNLRFGLRSATVGRGTSALVVVTLGLGLGTLVAVFDVVYRVLWRPLPFEEPDRLVALYEIESQGELDRGSVAPGNFADWRASSRSFEFMAAFNQTSMNLTGEGEPERLIVYSTSSTFFSTLHIEAALGRVFAPDEDRESAPRVAVLTGGLWRRRFGGDPDVVGRRILLDDVPYEIIGVLPQEFHFPSRDAEIYVPHAMSTEEASTRRSHYLDVVARLRDGVSLSSAREEMRALGRLVAEAHPETNSGETVGVFALQEELVASMKRPLVLLLGAIVGVLLIACVNVVNLLLARGTSRRRELSIRAALGASRARLAGELLSEAMVLAVAGSALALLAALWVRRWFVSWTPPHLALDEAGISGAAVLFTLASCALLGLGLGMVPALELTRRRLPTSVIEGGQRSVGLARSHTGVRKFLVVSEVTLALVLVTVSGLLLQSFYRLSRESPGFRPEEVLTMRVELSRTKYEEPHQRVAFYREVLDRIEHLPDVVSAGFVTMLPLTFQGGSTSFEIEGREEPSDSDRFAVFRSVTPDYFRALGVPVVRGRVFDRGDSSDSPRTAVINESFFRRFLGEVEPVGQRLRIWGEPHEIIGIVGDIRELERGGEPVPALYVTVYQRSFGFFDPRDLAVRARGDASGLARRIRAEIWAVDPDQPISYTRAMNDILNGSVSTERLQMVVFSIFGAAALLLAALGIYGVLSYAVARRTSEIALRMALGARSSDVLRLVLLQGMRPAVLGVGLGVGASLVVTRFFAGMLYGVEPNDPWTLAAITTTLTAVALLACLLPSWRATRVDPLVALRED
ncbi:MAG TPA: ABC transporter permease [Vicinamibacteria bacterium]|nr:ABC transporter permease [Vicinamibacteria bacterium]